MPVRRPPRARLAETLGLTLLLAVTVWGAAWTWLVGSVGGWRLLLGLLLAGTPVRARLGDVELAEGSRLFAPTSWRVALVDLSLVPRDPTRPELRVDRAWLEGWEPQRLFGRELAFRRVLLVGARVHAPVQRPIRPWVPRRGALRALVVDRLEVWDGAWHAEADPPLSGVEVRGIYAEVASLRYDPRFRELDGSAIGTIASFAVGALDLSRVRLERLVARRSDVELTGDARFGRSPVHFSGEVRRIHRGPRVRIDAAVRDVRLDDVVRAATGRPSPIDGELDADFELRAGPPLGRGQGVLEGKAKLVDGRLSAGAEPSRIVRELLYLGAWVDLDAERRIVLGDLAGTLRVRRGTVELERLAYATEHRSLYVRGRLDEDEGVALLLWQTPRRGLPPLGLVVTGQKDALTVRLARREELPGEERN